MDQYCPPRATAGEGLSLQGGRLHLQHGPIDLIVRAEGEQRLVQAAYAALEARFATILDELCEELPLLRRQVQSKQPRLHGVVARRMEAAVMPYAAERFITPMAAVAGAVAEEALAALCHGGPLRRAFVNNGGDIALHLAPGERFRVGLVDRPDRPSLFAGATVAHGSGIAGIATSGWHGRSFSFGIADAVTVCAAAAAQADAAASVIANAVDLPGHPAVRRVPASTIQADTDLGDRLVTRHVAPLAASDIASALEAGAAVADALVRSGLIVAAALHCQGQTRIVGSRPDLLAVS